MNEYKIEVQRPEYGHVYIRAENEEEARDIFWNDWPDIEWDDSGDTEIDDIELVEENIDGDEDGYEEEEETNERRPTNKLYLMREVEDDQETR